MATPVTGRKRQPHRERLTAEDDALNQIAREAEARLAAKRAARAEAREIRMKELERQQKEKYYGLDTKWGDIEQWMEDNECCSHRSQRNALPSEYSCYHGSGSRASSRASSARASPVVEEKSEQDFTEKGACTVSNLSAVTLAVVGGSSRRDSGDTSISVDTDASIREMKDLLAEAEEKYKKAMVSNAQLDNEKTNFMYQVDTLKDVLLELEEQLAESRRQYEEKSKEMERQKYAHSVLQFQFNKVKEVLQQREEMLMEIRQLQQEKESYGRVISNLQETIEWKDKKIGEHGIILNSEIATNGETSDKNEGHLEPSVKVNSETSPALKTGAVHPDMRLNHEAQRESFLEQIKALKGQREEKKKNGNMENTVCEDEVLENGTDIHLMDLQRDANRQISDLKFKLAKSEQQISALEQNIIRLEGQATRYKCAAENSEKVEDELKAEKRKLQRELRSALDKIEELEVGNNHLSKRLEKMKTNRSALLSQQ